MITAVKILDHRLKKNTTRTKHKSTKGSVYKYENNPKVDLTNKR